MSSVEKQVIEGYALANLESKGRVESLRQKRELGHTCPQCTLNIQCAQAMCCEAAQSESFVFSRKCNGTTTNL